jgi:hypothetical protein
MIEVKLVKCLLVFTDEEFYSMLKQNPEIWTAGIIRGKAIKRVKKVDAWRKSKKVIPTTTQSNK